MWPDVAIFKSPTKQAAGQRGAGRTARGLRWHRGQKKEDRFMNATRRIGVPQRPQGRPSRP